MVDAPGYPQVSGEESGGGAGAAHIDACLRSGERPAQARDPHDFFLLRHLGFKAQFPYTVQKMPGIVGEEYAPQSGSAPGQSGQQQRPVGDALGARDCRPEGLFRIFSRRPVIHTGHGIYLVCYHFEPLSHIRYRPMP